MLWIGTSGWFARLAGAGGFRTTRVAPPESIDIG
jgi:hypothetical protein